MYLDGLRLTTKNFKKYNRALGHDMNSMPPKYGEIKLNDSTAELSIISISYWQHPEITRK
jgi:hypothetical protein